MLYFTQTLHPAVIFAEHKIRDIYHFLHKNIGPPRTVLILQYNLWHLQVQQKTLKLMLSVVIQRCNIFSLYVLIPRKFFPENKKPIALW